jgi:lysophospholipase L1-like esterase
MSRRSAFIVSGLAAAAVALMPGSGAAPGAAAGAAAGRHHWVAAWGASPVVGTAIPFNSCPGGAGLTDQTVRNVIYLSAGGRSVRVRLSNTFGARSVQVGHASIALQAGNAEAVPGTVRELTFGGRSQVTMAAGGHALSDPVDLSVPALSTVLVSVYLPGPTGPVTNHPFTAQGNFLASGDTTLTAAGTGYTDTPCWMVVDGVDVNADPRVTGTVVALGDSITDTGNTTGNANRRWPDALARRLNAQRGSTLSVVNAGLGGNRLLEPRPDGDFWGVPALARLERDVFAQTGVRDVILLEGVNYIGFNAPADQIIAGYQQVIAQTHAQGLRIFWQAVNTWVRTSHAFDGVIDFAAATAVPGDPYTLRPEYDSGDHLHPNDAGCQAMADAVPLRLLR